jgi:sirohydrochlorin ferrochelatase
VTSELPVLIGCGHGTGEPAGRRALAHLRLAMAALRPELEVVAANVDVDVQRPGLMQVVGRLSAAGRRSVVVPLLLSAGYHVHVDIAQAVTASHGWSVAAAALGPDDTVVEVLQRRLAERGAGPDDAVVLAAAGSSDARAMADVEQVAAALGRHRGRPVTAGYLSAASPTVAQAVAAARAERPAGTTVSIATYLLAPGFFARRLATLGADLVAAPLAPDDVLAELALRRYDEALAALP